jgi:hypothetical protein
LFFYVAHKKSKYYATLRFTIVFSLVSKQHGLLMLDWCVVIELGNPLLTAALGTKWQVLEALASRGV